MDNTISVLSNALSSEESTPDFLPKEAILKEKTIYGFISSARIGMCNANTKHWQIRVTTGPGGVILRNNSEVFGNTRKVRAFTIGLLTNANLTYKLNSNLGVSLGVQYMYSELLRIRTYYHEEKVTVKLNSNDDVNLTRLNITTGLSYYF